MAVIATAGTTSTASVDPVAELARICREEKVWLHIDARLWRRVRNSSGVQMDHRRLERRRFDHHQSAQVAFRAARFQRAVCART